LAAPRDGTFTKGMLIFTLFRCSARQDMAYTLGNPTHVLRGAQARATLGVGLSSRSVLFM
jgi:hypothetical protein